METQLFGILILVIRIYLGFAVWNLSFPVNFRQLHYIQNLKNTV